MICSAVSNSSVFDRWVTSPVCSSIEGLVGNLAIRSSAACKVALGSGLASLLKPMWLSLIWTKVKSLPLAISAALAAPPRPSARGTPPLTVQTMPVPAQAMHFSNPRRLNSVALGLSRLLSSVIAPSIIYQDAMRCRPGTVAVYSRRCEEIRPSCRNPLTWGPRVVILDIGSSLVQACRHGREFRLRDALGYVQPEQTRDNSETEHPSGEDNAPAQDQNSWVVPHGSNSPRR